MGAQRASVARALVDPSAVPDLGSLSMLADAGVSGQRLTEEAIRAANGDLGWWGSYIKFVEDGIFQLHDVYQDAGLPFPYGTAIATFVLGVKLVTLPLNWQQLSTSSGMKAMKPQQDIIKKWYGDNKDMLNLETGLLFEKFNVNPLAGCLPSLAQIPVFLGVYYSVTSIAKAKVFDEGFLWIPNLSGPIADRTQGISWLTENWSNGAPNLGWETTLAYLTLPVILVITQTAALYLLGSFEALEEADDNTSQTTAVVLRLLPFMLGWFAMNAPAGLGVYWVFNNMLTTTQTLIIKKVTEKPPVDIPVNLAMLGPRREAREMDEPGSAPDWVERQKELVAEAKAREAEAAATPA